VSLNVIMELGDWDVQPGGFFPPPGTPSMCEWTVLPLCNLPVEGKQPLTRDGADRFRRSLIANGWRVRWQPRGLPLIQPGTGIKSFPIWSTSEPKESLMVLDNLE